MYLDYNKYLDETYCAFDHNLLCVKVYQGLSPPHQCHDQIYDQELHIQYIVWSLCCHRMNCEKGLKKALYTRAARTVIYIIETMMRLFVTMPTGVVPMGERLYWGKVPVGVAMEAKKGSVCAQTHMHVGVWERKCVHLMNGHVPELNFIQ